MTHRLVVADDDMEVLELLKYTFEAEHYQVITATDGQSAWEAVQREQPDAAVLDVTMPTLTGFEVCERIRSSGETCLLPVILLTSRIGTRDRVYGLKMGADDYVSKPFEPAELVARVARLIQRHRVAMAANPLTGLPGNVSIEEELRRRIAAQEPFSVLYTDIDYFKSFNDAYGFQRGDQVIRLVSSLLRATVRQAGAARDFIGHIGGDDFVVIADPGGVSGIATALIRQFDELAPREYDPLIREQGFLEGKDRQGRGQRFPLMSLSIGCVTVKPGSCKHTAAVAERARSMLKCAKQERGSAWCSEGMDTSE